MDAVLQNHSTARGARVPGAAVFLGVLPFLLIGGGLVFMEVPLETISFAVSSPVAMTLFFGGFLVTLAGVTVGWAASFPRWVMPYLFFAVMFTIFLPNASTPGLKIFGVAIWGERAWGLRAYIPLIAAVLLGAAISGSLTRAPARLGRALREDWTLLAFGGYGLLPMMAIFLEEVERWFSFPVILAEQALLVLGALLYMLLPGRGQRFAALAAAAALAGLVVGTGSAYYWAHYSSIQAGPPPNLFIALTNGSREAFLSLLFVLLPAGLMIFLNKEARDGNSAA